MGLQLLKETAVIRLFGLLKIPMIYFLKPAVIFLSEDKMEITIKLNRRSKNHLGSMYFGALCAGADLAVGALAHKIIQNSGVKVSFAFKEFNAKFLKRAEADVHFVCDQAALVKQMLKQAEETGERVNEWFRVSAYCPKINNEPVAEFELLFSLKKK